MLAAFERMFDPARLLRSTQYKSSTDLPTASETVGRLARVAWPSILESFLVSLVSMADTVMVGTLGHEAIASVGLVNQPRLIVLALFMSLNVGVTAVVSRRRGEGDRQGANHKPRRCDQKGLFVFHLRYSPYLCVLGRQARLDYSLV